MQTLARIALEGRNQCHFILLSNAMSLVGKYNWVLAEVAAAVAAQLDGFPQRNIYTIVWFVTRWQQQHSSPELNFFSTHEKETSVFPQR
jgi:hypothetical protein